MAILTPIVSGLTLFAFCSWAIYLGGLASVQENCASATAASGTDNHGYLSGITGFTDVTCYKLFRFYWFVMSIEFVSVVALAVAIATGNLFKTRLSFLGLFAINTILYIMTTNSFLTANSLGYYNHGQPKHRMRTTVAGAIMAATFNVLLTVVLGYEEDASVPEVQVQKDQTAV
uniref:Uncharacterized protein n=1 Tax=Polytomella parva TaxID=51329 RepID=A0A7S0YIG7_9CHLO